MYTNAASLKSPTGDDLEIVGLDYIILNGYADAVKWLERAVEIEPKNREAGIIWGVLTTRKCVCRMPGRHF
jgi:hypothetical protein